MGKKKLLAVVFFSGVFLLLAGMMTAEAASVVPYVFKEPAAGSDGQIMFNDQNISAGSDVTYDKTTSRIGIGVPLPEHLLDVNGFVEALYFVSQDGPVGISDASLWNGLSLDAYAGIDIAVQANVCVGTDCVTGMVFSDDLVLSENNLRYTFYDTSPEGADWQIIANDSNNGGQNYLGIAEISPAPATPFQVQAPAVDSSLVLQETSGNVGINTSSPRSAVQVAGYTQLAETTGIPPASDCDAMTERGRIIMDDTSNILWVCVDSGWTGK